MEALYTEIIVRTIKIATISTILVTIFSIIMVILLRKIPIKLRVFIELAINISLFLSPSVIGYLLIILLGKNGILGYYLYKYLNITLLFSWQSGIIASFVVTLPIMYNSIKTGIYDIDKSYFEVAEEVGSSSFQVVRFIILPLIKKNILAGMLLSFGRAIGEFGATLMLAGNIPRKTQTISMAIYSASESGDTATANYFLVVIIIISLMVMIIYNYLFSKKG